MEEELVTPGVEDLRQKLEQVDGKLEAPNNLLYQMVEEHVELRSCSNFNRKRDEEREKITPILAATSLAQPSWTN